MVKPPTKQHRNEKESGDKSPHSIKRSLVQGLAEHLTAYVEGSSFVSCRRNILAFTDLALPGTIPARTGTGTLAVCSTCRDRDILFSGAADHYFPGPYRSRTTP